MYMGRHVDASVPDDRLSDGCGPIAPPAPAQDAPGGIIIIGAIGASVIPGPYESDGIVAGTRDAGDISTAIPTAAEDDDDEDEEDADVADWAMGGAEAEPAHRLSAPAIAPELVADLLPDASWPAPVRCPTPALPGRGNGIWCEVDADAPDEADECEAADEDEEGANPARGPTAGR